MKLYAWYLPTMGSDLKQLLREKVVVGSWDLRPIEVAAPRVILVRKETLHLPDSSRLFVCAAAPSNPGDGLVTIGVSADGISLCHVSSVASPIFATVATGKGGFLELRILDENAGADEKA